MSNRDDGRCDRCGCELNPIDWCQGCIESRCKVHKRLRARSDAKYCGDECRSIDHAERRKDRRERAKAQQLLNSPSTR